MEFFLNENESLDELNIKNYKIIQHLNKFRFGMDAVWLSDFAKVGKNDKVLDIGTGTGIIPILMEAKYQNTSYVAFEIQKESAEMAKRSVDLNNLSDKIKIINDDIKNIKNHYNAGYFDVVTSNPPYLLNDSGKINENVEKAIARHELLCTIDDVINFGGNSLKFGGSFYIVHRANRLVDIFCAMRKYNIEPKVIQFICSHFGKEPKTILIKGVKFGKFGLLVKPNLYIDAVN